MRLSLYLLSLFSCTVSALVPEGYKTYNELFQQLSTTPPNPVNQHELIDSLLKMVPSYVFHAVSMNSTKDVDPSIAASIIPMQVNLTASLQHLNNTAKTYQTDATWQQAVADVFIPLHDAHTRYNKPEPYRYASYQHPIILSARANADGTSSSLYLFPQSSLIPIYDELYNITSNITAYDGWKVMTINDEDAMQHILTFADKDIGYTKDISSRVNLAINGYGDGKGYYVIRQQQSMGTPKHNITTYGLINEKTNERHNLTLNWIGVYMPQNSTSTSMNHSIHDKAKTELETIAAASHQHVHGNIDTIMDVTPDVTFQMWNDGVTGILKISTFNPQSYHTFIGAIEQAIVEHKQKAPNGRLLIDLRANGGGDICLGYATLRYIFPSLADGTVWPSSLYIGDATGVNGRYEMMHSPLFARLAEAGYAVQSQSPANQTLCGTDPETVGYTTPCSWYNPMTGQQYKDTTFLNGPTRTRGGYIQTYSQLIHEGCANMSQQWVPATHTSYTPDNIILVSDGLCGSTCSVFSSFIQQHGLGKTLVMSSIKLQPKQQFWSFPGGEVETIDYIRTLASRYHLQNHTLMPQTLPDKATFRFAIRQIYPWNIPQLLMPLEFIHVPAHFQSLYNSSYNDTSIIYPHAITYFNTCVSGVGDTAYPCDVPHGKGYYTCVDGVRTKTCQVMNCDDGHFFNGQTCIPCTAGTYRIANTSRSIDTCDTCTNAAVEELSTSSSVTCTTSYHQTGVTSSTCPYTVSCSESTRNAIIIGAASGVGSALIVGGIVFCVMNSKLKKSQGLDESLLGH